MVVQNAIHKVAESSSNDRRQLGDRQSSATAPSGDSSGRDIESGAPIADMVLPMNKSDATMSLDFVGCCACYVRYM